MATNTTNSTTYLCYAMHDFPDSTLLAKYTTPQQIGSYTFKVLGQKGRKRANTIEKGNTCILRFQRKLVELMPLPIDLSADNAPYGLCYNFYLEKENYGLQHYKLQASYYGFNIITLPQHDYKRAVAAKIASQSESAAIYIDDAIVALAKNLPITEPIEKLYTRYLKLLALWRSQPQEPEGLLAFERSFSVASKIVNQFLGEKEDG
jgi:hypothetical protein